MPKISDLPETTVLKTGHILQLVDTAAAPSVANEKISIQNLVLEISAFGLLTGVGTSAYSPTTTPQDLANWGSGIIGGASSIVADPVSGTLTVAQNGLFNVMAHLVYDSGAQNIDHVIQVGINSVAGEIISTMFVSSAQQSSVSLNGGNYINLTAGQAVSLMGSSTSADAGRTIASRWLYLSRVD